MRWQDLVFWPQAHLRQVGWVVIAGLGVLGVNALIIPNVEPIYPAELGVSSEIPGSGLNVQSEHNDFVTRPLFIWNRRPTQVVVEVAMPEPAPQAPESTLEGVGLLGVFASGGVSGAVLKLEDGTRSRVYVGEGVNGWQLTETGLRYAVFVSPSGATSQLELAVASTLPPLEVVPSTVGSPAPDTTTATPANPASEGPSRQSAGPVTFGSIARAKELEIQRRQNASDEESTDG